MNLDNYKNSIIGSLAGTGLLFNLFAACSELFTGLSVGSIFCFLLIILAVLFIEDDSWFS